MLFSGVSFGFIFQLTAVSWALVLISSLTTLMTQLSKFKAFKYQQASKLQNLAFVPNLWQFMIDLLIMSVVFTQMQYCGFALLFLFYGWRAFAFMMEQRKLKSRRVMESDEKFVAV